MFTTSSLFGMSHTFTPIFSSFTFHYPSNISCIWVLFSSFKKKIGYYLGLGDFFTFSQEMHSNYSLCQLIPRIRAFKSLCVITIMHMNNLGHH